MIFVIEKLFREFNQENFKFVVNFFEVCNFIFEKGLLNKCRINSMNSFVIQNIKKEMVFFEKWCYSYEQIGEFIYWMLYCFNNF